MKIVNKTMYSTRLLRSIICAVHTKQAKWGRGRLRTWGALRITIAYTAHRSDPRWHGGNATMDGRRMTLTLPRDRADVAEFAATIRHELWHSYGIDHSDMPPSVLDCRRTEWVDEFVERFGREFFPSEEPPALTRSERAAARAERDLRNAERRLVAWRSKKRRAETGIATALRDIKSAQRRIERNG